MKTLVIYVNTGRICLMPHGETQAPQCLPSVWADIPDGAVLKRIDLTDPDKPQPVYAYLPETAMT